MLPSKKSSSSSIIWKDTEGSFRVVEGRNPKPKPLNPARYFGSNPETDKNDSLQQAWWCPETDTPQPGASSFEGLLGSTHMIDLTDLIEKTHLPRGQVRLVAKTEFLSPGMSLCDRVAKLKIDRAENSGALKQGMSVVIADCSDFGASVAMVCAMRGFPLVCCVPGEGSNADKLDTLKAYGARIVVGGDLSPAQEAERLCAQNPKIFFLLLGPSGVEDSEAGFVAMGPEIWDQTNGYLSHFVGHESPTLHGAGRFLRERDQTIGLYCSRPSGPVFAKFAEQGELHASPESEELDYGEEVLVGDQESLDCCLRLCREQGIMAGAISGMNVCAALQLAAKVEKPALIVTVLPDIGVKFLSTVFNDEWIQTNRLQAGTRDLEIPGCMDLDCPGCSTKRPELCPKSLSSLSPSQRPRTLLTPNSELTPSAAKAAKPTPRKIKTASAAGVGHLGLTRHFKRYEDLIGTTPLIDLSHLIDPTKSHYAVKVLAKCEFLNPGFSLKDRIARNILDKAESTGLLRPGMVVVAASSGNTGAATAMLCAMRGYACIITTCPKCSREKQDAIKAYGAHLLITAAGLSESSPDHYMNVAKRLCEQNPSLYYDVDQYDTLANPEGHYLTLGPEIYEQSQCEITHFICAGSTGGTISGVGKYLKERDPNVKVVLADPVGSVFTNYFLSGNVGKPGKYLVEGVGKGSIPGAMNFTLVDAVLPVSDAEAFATCSRLAREEGIWPGGSSGLNVFAALKLAEMVESGPCTIVTVMPDLGLKYLTKIYNEEWLTTNKLNTPARPHVDDLSPIQF